MVGTIKLIPLAIPYSGTFLIINKIQLDDMPGEFREENSCSKGGVEDGDVEEDGVEDGDGWRWGGSWRRKLRNIS